MKRRLSPNAQFAASKVVLQEIGRGCTTLSIPEGGSDEWIRSRMAPATASIGTQFTGYITSMLHIIEQ